MAHETGVPAIHVEHMECLSCLCFQPVCGIGDEHMTECALSAYLSLIQNQIREFNGKSERLYRHH